MDQTDSPAPYHLPVLVETVTELFAPAADGVIVDGTLGGAGHSVALLTAYPHLRIIGLDRDPDAIANAPHDARLTPMQANFADLDGILGEATVDGVLLDLGVSSHQLDTPQRGFSYRSEGPLDMRMGRDTTRRAHDIVNEWPRDELAAVLRRFGEERHAGRIADAIVRNRPIEDTRRLAAVVADAVPAPARRARHPARRVFQAIRIAVNEELEALRVGLDAAVEHLAPRGRLVVISYHSLEDRMVKRRIARGAAGCICPPDLPVCGCGRAAELRALTRKAIRPSAAEIEANPRSRSAVLRAAEKVAA
ncbi:MAG: 16S rRNA (cytosine(1402)-N(4))-methyltransferase RsmH [Actinobacteria bacterium]|nr:MAG: 16S rRNA (cytosine(1402)-N(4))-methyltransferase RsmH [Actinomycetota bacterium]